MKKSLYILTLLIASSSVYSCFGQSGKYYTIRDFESWSSINLDYKASKKLSFGLGEQIRLKDNSSTVNQFFTNASAEYKLTKAFRLGTEFRYIRLNDTEGNVQGYETHFRSAFYTKFQHKIKRFEMKYRLQFQSRKEWGLAQGVNSEPTNKLRLKVGGSYNIKKWKLDPVLSTEIFRTIGTNGDFSKIRGTLGTSFDSKKAGNFGLFYRLEKDLDELYPQTTHILGLKYTYSLKRKKK